MDESLNMLNNNVVYKSRSTSADDEWPEHIIEAGSCPLSTATPTNGMVYRRNDGNWESRYQKNTREGKKQYKEQLLRCQSTGLSCYYEEGEHTENAAVHEAWANQGTVSAVLNHEHGVIQQTGNNPQHFTLWLKKKHLDNAAILFKVHS